MPRTSDEKENGKSRDEDICAPDTPPGPDPTPPAVPPHKHPQAHPRPSPRDRHPPRTAAARSEVE